MRWVENRIITANERDNQPAEAPPPVAREEELNKF
jgi:hypothetical protein